MLLRGQHTSHRKLSRRKLSLQWREIFLPTGSGAINFLPTGSGAINFLPTGSAAINILIIINIRKQKLPKNIFDGELQGSGIGRRVSIAEHALHGSRARQGPHK